MGPFPGQPRALILAVGPLALWPFLPLGKGALILILGGALVVVLSFAWLSARPRIGIILLPEKLRARSPASTPMRPHLDMQWAKGFQTRASSFGLRNTQVVIAGPDRCVLMVRACPSCRNLGPHRGGCEHERAGLERAARFDFPGALVTEVSCNLMRTGACVFQVRQGQPL